MSTNPDMSDSSPTPPDIESRIEAAAGTERAVWSALRTVEDPELPVSIVDLGLIYDLGVDDGRVDVDLTLTYSGCPARDLIVDEAAAAVREVPGVDEVSVRLVYAPPWGFERITPTGRKKLNDHGLAVPGDEDAPDPTCHE